MTETDTEGSAQSRALTTFSCVWAIASAFHVASFGHWDRGLIVVLAAVWLLLKPSSAGRLALLSVAQLTVVALFSPFISNHWLFTGAVNAVILCSFSLAAIPARSVHVDGDRLIGTLGPVVRWMVLVLYFWVVFHKLNTDFFSLDTSCGADFYALQIERLPFLPDAGWAAWGAIVATVVVEALIGVLLVFRKTRHVGIMLGVTFHGVIALNPRSPFFNFSSMLFAVFALFLPEDFYERLFDAAKDRARVGVAVVFGALMLTGLLPQSSDGALLIWVFYFLAVLATLVAFLGFRAGDSTEPARTFFSIRPRWLVIFPILLMVNGFQPYLGLKTETSFAMYSNLRTERGESNHFVFGNGMELFDYQRDFVRIVESNNPALQHLAKTGLLTSMYELRRITSQLPDTSVTYIRDGQRIEVPRTGDDDVLSRPIPLWKRKLIYLRPIDSGDRQACHH